MNIIHKNEGQKIAFNVEGTKIFFRDELMLDLSKYERDYDVEIDICQDDDHILIAGLSKYYVANIIIPARQYQDPEKRFLFLSAWIMSPWFCGRLWRWNNGKL